MGGKSSNSNASSTDIRNTDNRMALQDAVGLGENASFSGNVNINSSDAVRAVAEMGVVQLNGVATLGGAVVDLGGRVIDRTADTFDNTVNRGVQLVDGLIEESYNYSGGVIRQANELTRANLDRNAQIVETLSKQNTALGIGLAETAMKAYQPTDNKIFDNLQNVALASAAAVAVVAIFRKGK